MKISAHVLANTFILLCLHIVYIIQTTPIHANKRHEGASICKKFGSLKNHRAGVELNTQTEKNENENE
jgi:hypothetical protein